MSCPLRPALQAGFLIAMNCCTPAKSAAAEVAKEVALPASLNVPAATIKAPAAQKNVKQAARRKAIETLLLDITINDQRLGTIVLAEQLPGGPLLLPVDAWSAARLAPLAQLVTLSDGTPAYPLDGVAGATWNIDRQKMSMDITAPAAAFTAESFDATKSLQAAPPRSQPGLMLDYNLSLNRGSNNDISSGALLEAVAFGGFGNLVSSALVIQDASGRRADRLDTYWRYDLPNRMETLILGDTVGVGGGWSSPVRYGGVRWGRDFGMRPGFVTLPQLTLAGSAALPSTVDVLINNAQRLSQKVQPGPFDLSNVPIVTGAGEVNLVVRDLLGRETVLRQSYYASPRLLAPGLTDFSFEAGRLRSGYGSSSVYGAPFGAATWRQGLTGSLTGEARIEWQGARRAAGFDLASLLGHWGAARFALATSSGNLQGLQENGYVLKTGLERSTPRGGGTLQYERASAHFSPFGEATNEMAAAQRARERWLASLGGPLWGSTTGGASFVRQTRWDGDRLQMLGLSLSMQTWRQASLNLSLSKRLDQDRSWSGAISLSMSLDGGIRTSSQISRGPDGQLSSTIGAAGNVPSGPGLGWRVQAGSEKSQRAQAGLQYNTSVAEWALDAASDAQGQIATRGSGRGTVGWLGGMVFASRPVGQTSMAVVRVDGVEGVPIMRSHQVVAVTNANGLAFIPGLLPWQSNQIAIDMLDLPLDVTVENTVIDVTPFARSGMLIDFGARSSRQALLVLRQADGTPVPIGARVRLLPAGPEFIVGRRGEAWLTDLADERQRVRVSWTGDGCTLELTIPKSIDGMPGDIGPLVCTQP
jgi:outer membrane usher protein